MTEPRVPLAPHRLARPAALASARRAALVSNPSGAATVAALFDRCGALPPVVLAADALLVATRVARGATGAARVVVRGSPLAARAADGLACADSERSGSDTGAEAVARGAGCEAWTVGAEATTDISGVAGAASCCVPARRAATAAIMTATPANIQTARSALLSPPPSTMTDGGNVEVVAPAGTEGGKDD
ncbi:MAG: hypothetical protein JW940_02875 [Polyangiaceae bacterium]|nr:hypothetical protein [Polyangiaceae bacterium]